VSVAEYPLAPDPSEEWPGATRRYDLVKEAVLALLAVTLLTLLLSALLSSPDVKPVTIAGWAAADSKDLIATAVAELDGTSGVATYGPPYTEYPGAGQNVIGGLSLQRLAGVQIPIDPARAFVLGPLSVPAHTDPTLAQALLAYERAPAAQRQAWATAYGKEIDKGQGVNLTPGNYGPVPTLMAAYLQMAESGGLDEALTSTGSFYQSNFTKALLFLADGSYLESLAEKQNLLGSQWGMMNETGNYPGQAWLWLYTFWYQIPPFSTSENADAQIWGIMGVLSLLFVLIPFIPGVRSIPKWVPIYKLIWRDYYREARRANAP
jgi:hypothetical protein